MNETILIVDDDVKLREILREYFEEYGHTILELPDGTTAASTVAAKRPDIVLLDVMMPRMDGFEVLREIRGVSRVPVIMLTAKGEDSDRIVGLELGADDYIPKPFNPRELLARIRAVLRRTVAPTASEFDGATQLQAGGLTLDTPRQMLLVNGDEHELSSAEFNLMSVFMRHPDVVLSREKLMNLAWGRDYEAYDRTIDVHVSKLRGLLKEYEGHEKRIRTVWGSGYKFVGSA
ncbi:response regulator [Salidesulfovibrio onnuriiensis]|uniref:response regulator n=1 Tax=Salidesulfovibrio onnuriiensis TaxID=2583823 RepID=UPI0011C959D1|nr:response regulator transcription factor [Salidesulfovibrio onnuriiensis]